MICLTYVLYRVSMLYRKIARFISRDNSCVQLKIACCTAAEIANNTAISISRMFRRITVYYIGSSLGFASHPAEQCECKTNWYTGINNKISSCRSGDFRSDWFRTLPEISIDEHVFSLRLGLSRTPRLLGDSRVKRKKSRGSDKGDQLASLLARDPFARAFFTLGRL